MMKLNLAKIRRNRRITQARLAKLSGVAQGYISVLERGEHDNPGLQVICKFKKALGCTLDDLIDCGDE